MAFFRRKRLAGVVDTQGSRIQGWAYDASTSRPVSVDFYVDGQKVGNTIADLYRADLLSVSPDGRCAFEYALPPQFFDGIPRTIEVRARGGVGPLSNGSFTVRLLSHDYYVGLTRWVLRAGLWAMSCIIGDGTVEIGGWYIPAPGNKYGRITVNGHAIDALISDGAADWPTALPPQTAIHQFKSKIPLEADWTELEFSFGLERPFRPLQNFYYPLFEIAMPEPKRRLRVHGNESEFTFNLEGYSTAIKLDVMAKRFIGRPLAGLGPVLDWGCGCGRVGRFVARNGADLYGVDIDTDNVLWCTENLNGHFVSISPEPPTPYADNFFGAIYGVSVFTHLNQQYEELWLAELHRVAQPGALLLLSVLGGVAAARGGLLEHVFAADAAEGFFDAGSNQGIDLVTKGSAYYRNVFHQPGYIARVWGKYFEILAIEEGVIGNHQDLVVARKPVRAQ